MISQKETEILGILQSQNMVAGSQIDSRNQSQTLLGAGCSIAETSLHASSH